MPASLSPECSGQLRDRPNAQLNPPGDLYGRSGTQPPRAAASYIWLAYSCFFFIEPVMRHTTRYWLQQMPFYAVFLALYITYVRVPRDRLRRIVLASLFVLGLVDIPSNVGGSCFFVYVASLLPFCVESATVFFAVAAAEIVALAIESRFFPASSITYLITGFFTLVVGISNLFIAQGKRAELRLHQAEEQNLVLAAVAERERIARDLHDVLGHTLSVIVLKAELAGRLIGLGDAEAAARAAHEIADVERTARTALAEVRETIGGYRARGLSAEVEQARQTLDAAGVKLLCESAPPALRPREETVLSLAVREAVTNIVRHAHATACTMRFSTTDEGFAALEIVDNGQAGPAHTAVREGNGLRGMRARVEELGGRFQIRADGGTRLLIELPRSGTASGPASSSPLLELADPAAGSRG